MENPWIAMDLQKLDPCSISDMEQPVADFINRILMEEDECIESRTTRPLSILDNDHDGALVLYQVILKDFFDILADNNNITAINDRNGDSCPASSGSSTCSSCVPADLHSRSLTDAGSSHIYGNSSTSTDPSGGDIQGEELLSDCSFIEFEVWAQHVLSSASLIASADDFDRLDHVLQTDPSSTESCDPVHDLLQEPPAARQNQRCSGHGDVEAGRTQWQHTPPHQGRTMATIGRDEAHKFMNMDTEAQKRDMYRKRGDGYAAATLVSAPPPPTLAKEERDFSFNEELGEVIQAEYENLYAREPYEDRINDPVAGSKSAAGSKRKGSAAGYYDLEELLMSCAQAVSRSDNKKAMGIVEQIKRQGASPKGGSCLHRMAFQFCRALEARLHGSGPALYASELAAVTDFPAATYIRAWLRTFERLHYTKIFYFFANQCFLAAACQAHVHRLHVVDYGISFGTQWAYLIKALSQREGGNPPLLVLTGVQFPNKVRAAEIAGRRLAEFAAALNVGFRFHAVASTSRWEDLDEDALGIDVESRSKTAVVVNIFRQLQFIPDETTVLQDDISADLNLPPGLHANNTQPSPREKLLCRIRSLNPELVVVGVNNAGLNVPTFLTRFRNALQHFSSLLEMLEVMTEDSPERRLMEKLFTKSILNVVACEGADRVVRPETYRQWERRLQRAGWEQLPVPAGVLRRSMEYVKERYQRDCTVMVDNSSPWLLTGWKGRTYLGMSAWRPAS